MTLMIYAPFGRRINPLFNDTLGLRHTPAVWAPRCNVYEDAPRFVVEAALPWLDAKEIDIQVEDGVLTLVGKRNTAHRPAQTSLVKEIGVGPSSWSFTLPTKREATTPRRIAIDTK